MVNKWVVLDLWRRLRLTSVRIDRIVFVATPNDVPEKIPRREIFIVGNHEYQKWALFLCPCGFNHKLILNLQTHVAPSWQFSFGSQGPSLHPSIDSLTTRRCHFWLREGRASWVRKSRTT